MTVEVHGTIISEFTEIDSVIIKEKPVIRNLQLTTKPFKKTKQQIITDIIPNVSNETDIE